MERRRLLSGMALLLLQALPSPLSARAEPPQVRGRGVGAGLGAWGVVEAWLEGAGDGLADGWRRLKECCCQELRGRERDIHAWSGHNLRGRWCFAEGHLFRGQEGGRGWVPRECGAFETVVRSGGLA